MLTRQIKNRIITFLGFVALISWAFVYNSRSGPTQEVKFNDKPAPQSKKINSTNQGNMATVRKADKDWIAAETEIYARQNVLNERLSQLKGDSILDFILRRGDVKQKHIALTFDDGPHPGFTEKLLAILKEENVKATFFVVGFMAEKHPELVKLIAKDGHEIANHSYSHVTLSKLPNDQVLTEWKANSDVIKQITGKSPKYCRPPGGDFNKTTVQLAASLGLTTVLWTDDPGDYANPGDQILLKRVTKTLESGAIVLLHDGSQDTLDTLAEFIKIARSKGFTFVSLNELSK